MVLNERVFEFVPARNGLPTLQASSPDSLRELPDVPVLSETLLRMELVVRGRSVDLSEISQVVLSDIGATLQIMRLVAREDAFENDRVPRIEDCISGLGVQACLDAMSRRPLKRSTRPPAVIEAWTHARIVAENCRYLAAETSGSASPDEAYLVGLFHDLGRLPVILGWNRTFALPIDPVLVGLRVAEAWSLPECVVTYFSELRSPAHGHRWAEIVEQAHAGVQYFVPAHAPVDHIPVQLQARASLQLA
jgi:hypothetical protein